MYQFSKHHDMGKGSSNAFNLLSIWYVETFYIIDILFVTMTAAFI